MLGKFDCNLLPQTQVPGIIIQPLYDGCIYYGQIDNSNGGHDVKVLIQHVDLKKRSIRGYLNECNFNGRKAETTKYFEGDIVSESKPFFTNKWDVPSSTDNDIWKKFTFLKSFDNLLLPDFDYDVLDQSDYIFMRWKEHSLVHDDDEMDSNRSSGLANGGGLYYISLNKRRFSIDGYGRGLERLPGESSREPKTRHLSMKLLREPTTAVFSFC